jgi:cytochrome c biogenesis protein CcmG, thiol:disulfide interchange protein DsbE
MTAISSCGATVYSPRVLYEELRRHAPGERVEIAIERAGKPHSLTVEIEEGPHRSAFRRSALIGKPAPDVTLTTLDGAPFVLSSQRGHVVVLVFWAAWCGSCLEAIEGLRGVQRRVAAKGVVVASITSDEPDELRAVVADRRIDVPVTVDADQGINDAFGVQALPTIVIIDKAGIVRAVLVDAGPRATEAITTRLAK